MQKSMSEEDRLCVIQAAAECFDAKGVKRTTYAQIAVKSGVSVDVIRSEFKVKSALALAVQAIQLEQLKKEYLANMPDATPRETLKYIIRKRMEFAEVRQDRTKLFFVSAFQNRQPWTAMLDQLIWQLSVEFASIVGRGAREGRYKKGVDITVAVKTLTSIYLTTFVTLGIRSKEFDLEMIWSVMEPQIDFVFNSLQK